MTNGPDAPDCDVGRHHPLTRLLHWCVFVLVLVAAAAIITRAYIDSSLERKLLLQIHQSAGLAVLGLTLVRLAWRLGARAHTLHEGFPSMIRISAITAHATLYLTLFALTIVGWLTSDAFGQPLRFLGAIPLPTLIGRNRDFGDDLQGGAGGGKMKYDGLGNAAERAAIIEFLDHQK